MSAFKAYIDSITNNTASNISALESSTAALSKRISDGTSLIAAADQKGEAALTILGRTTSSTSRYKLNDLSDVTVEGSRLTTISDGFVSNTDIDAKIGHAVAAGTNAISTSSLVTGTVDI